MLPLVVTAAAFLLGLHAGWRLRGRYDREQADEIAADALSRALGLEPDSREERQEVVN
jgi:hypothetical protein